MKTSFSRLWTTVGCFLLASAATAQKNLSDYSIVDDCTFQPVGSSTRTTSPYFSFRNCKAQRRLSSMPTAPTC